MTVVVREAFCAFAGGAGGLWSRSLDKGCEKCEVKTTRNEVERCTEKRNRTIKIMKITETNAVNY